MGRSTDQSRCHRSLRFDTDIGQNSVPHIVPQDMLNTYTHITQRRESIDMNVDITQADSSHENTKVTCINVALMILKIDCLYLENKSMAIQEQHRQNILEI